MGCWPTISIRTATPITATNFSNAAHGSLSLDEDGSFTYTPDAGYTGTDTATYYISDGTTTASAVVSFDVVDTAPVAATDFYHLAENGSLTVSAANGLLKNDYDADGNTITATNFSNAAHGTLNLDEDGSFIYTPNAGYSGTDTATYYISDGTKTASATVSFQVGLVGVIANPDTYSVFEGGTLSVTAANGVLANDYADTGRRGSSLIATNFSNPTHGALSLNENGSLVYTPTAGYVGTDRFTYYISNGTITASTTDTIDVIQPLLVATPDIYAMQAGGTLVVAVDKGVLANDVTTGGTLEATNFSNALTRHR